MTTFLPFVKEERPDRPPSALGACFGITHSGFRALIHVSCSPVNEDCMPRRMAFRPKRSSMCRLGSCNASAESDKRTCTTSMARRRRVSRFRRVSGRRPRIGCSRNTTVALERPKTLEGSDATESSPEPGERVGRRQRGTAHGIGGAICLAAAIDTCGARVYKQPSPQGAFFLCSYGRGGRYGPGARVLRLPRARRQARWLRSCRDRGDDL